MTAEPEAVTVGYATFKPGAWYAPHLGRGFRRQFIGVYQRLPWVRGDVVMYRRLDGTPAGISPKSWLAWVGREVEP